MSARPPARRGDLATTLVADRSRTDILHSLFSTYVEIHATELGLFLGIVVGLFFVLDRPLWGVSVLCGVMILAIFPIDGALLAHETIRAKPWYFCFGILAGALVSSVPVAALRNRSSPDGPAWEPLE